jgi:exopolysaccharide biosynthesis polyprenyl glycosylphosphotransferase
MTTIRKPPERAPYGRRPSAGVPGGDRAPGRRRAPVVRPVPQPPSVVAATAAASGPQVPWPVLADGAALIVSLLLVAARLGTVAADARLFLAALTISSLYVWLLFLQFRSLATILRRRRRLPYAMPALAAAGAVVVLGVGRVAIPWVEVVIFVGVWTIGLALGRLVLAQRQAPLRVLLIGSPPFRGEIEGHPDLEVVSLDEPPARMNGWDVVATDPAERYDREWLQWISHADMYDVKVISAPLLLETLTARVPTEMLHGRWAFEVLHGRSRYLFWKRMFDAVGVVLAAPLLLPLAGLVALVVWIDTGRPILFVQDRVGLGGRPFRMVKFRTMVANAEHAGSAFAEAGDPRITRVGRFLRQYRLDEIPQFWNVLVGDMSIIGPRPEQLSFAEQFDEEIPLYQLRHNLRPGITGWAQVRQGYAADTIETRTKLRYDFYYVKHCSFALDVEIVLRTIRTILTGFGSR